jgi:O-antigen ligase
MVVINFHVSPINSYWDTQRFYQVGVVIVSALLFILYSQNSASYHFRAPQLLISLAFGFLLLTNSFSAYPLIGYLETMNSTLLLLALFMFAMPWFNHDNTAKFEENIILLIALGFCFYLLKTFAIFFIGLADSAKPDEWLVVHNFSNKRFLNHLQVLTLPLMIVFSLRSRSLLIQRLCLLAAILSVSVLLFLSARAAILAIVVSSCVVLFTLKDRKMFYRFLVVSFFGGIVFVLAFKSLPVLLYGSSEASFHLRVGSSGRWRLWIEGLALLKQHWLFGVGGLQYAFLVPSGSGHPHNFFLQIAIEYGVLILLLIVYFIIRFLIVLSSMLKTGNLTDLQIASLWALIAAVVVSLFSGIWVAPLSQLLLVMIAAPLVSAYFSFSDGKNLAKDAMLLRVRPLIIKLIVGCSLIAFVFVFVFEVERRYLVDGSAAVERSLDHVRFWQGSTWPKLKANDS